MTSAPSFKGQGFKDRVAAGYAGLSPQLRRAADFIAANGQEVATRSLRQVAAAAGVTPPTLSRLARALGFDSYETLRELAREELGRRRTSFAERARALRNGEADGTMILGQAQAAIGNIETLVEETDQARLEEAARLLAGARRVCLIGGMSSGAFVNYIAYMASMVQDGWQVAGLGGGTGTAKLIEVGPGDAILAMTITPAYRRTVEAVQRARDRGARVVAITDGPRNPLAGLADIGFTVAIESPHFFTSYAAAMVLVETLMTMVVREAGAAGEARVAEVEAAHRALGDYRAE